MTAGAMASHDWLAATAVAIAQDTEENASAKVARRDDVWRRRKYRRLAWLRNHI